MAKKIMETRVIVVKNCSECPNGFLIANRLNDRMCVIDGDTNIVYDFRKGIPDWCPLEDAEGEE